MKITNETVDYYFYHHELYFREGHIYSEEEMRALGFDEHQGSSDEYHDLGGLDSYEYLDRVINTFKKVIVHTEAGFVQDVIHIYEKGKLTNFFILKIDDKKDEEARYQYYKATRGLEPMTVKQYLSRERKAIKEYEKREAERLKREGE